MAVTPWDGPGWTLGLVLGGARSGKTRFALELGCRWPKPWTYVATALPFDEEMRARIEQHRQVRGTAWQTVEADKDLASVLARVLPTSRFVVVDCVTLWMSRCLTEGMDDDAVLSQIEGVIRAVRSAQTPCVFVSNEVGWGIVPAYPLGRRFRDLAGSVHQRLAQAADWVVVTIAGYPLTLKPSPF